MTKSEMRKALQEGMKVFVQGGNQVVQCAPKAHVERAPRKAKEQAEVDHKNLPMALKIRFGLQNK